MKGLRRFVQEHFAAVAIVAAAVVAFGVWQAVIAVSFSRPAASPVSSAAARVRGELPAVTRTSAGSEGGPARNAAPAGHATDMTASGAATSSPSSGSPSASSTTAGAAATSGRAPAGPATASGASGVPSPGTGRADPFSPLVTPPSANRPASTNPPLPPVPPLAPGALSPSATTPPGSALRGAQGQLQLTGIVYGPTAVAILSDGATSYIVAPGDTVTSGVRIIAIDAENSTVMLASRDQSWQLRLGGGTSR
jgi:hypothetical protein